MYDINEKSYKENIGPGGAKEIEIQWIAMRKISDYFRFRIRMVARFTQMVTVEIQREGVNVKRDKADMEIKFWCWLERDYENKWEQNPVTKFLRGVYDKYIVRSRIDFYEGKLVGEVNDFIDQMKSYLALSIK